MANSNVSAGNPAHTQDQLLQELALERDARQRALLELAHQRRYAELTDRHSGIVLADEGLDDLLQHLLSLFVDVVGASAGFLALSEGERMVSHAELGPEANGTRELSFPIAGCFDGYRLVTGDPSGALLVREPGGAVLFGDGGAQNVHVLRLTRADRLLGAVVLATPDARIISDEDAHMLGVLAARTAAAVAQLLAQDTLRGEIRARNEVLAVVADDLHSPLNVISLAANMVLGRAPEQSGHGPVERITHAAQRETRLLRDLLDISAMEAGRFSIERHGRVDPAELLLSAVESQESLAAEASVIIASDLSPELPAIDVDEERLLEVLEGLVGNAVKVTSPGGTITVGAMRDADKIKFWVRDSGAGIADTDLPHIFDRFWQAKRDRRGTGLGLTMCKGIVEAHGGRIWAESTIGRGTTLSFTIPAVVVTASTVQSTQIANILMVDDRPENLLVLRAILERPDYRLVTADSGEKALSLALSEHFSVALIDIAMPGMSGLDVAIHFKALERSRDIPIIFITAFGDDPEEIHHAYAAGGADYLVKPVDAEIVKKKVAVFVELRRRKQGSLPPLREKMATS
jgi:signal transduction histidine kinase/ActR/RegA family two-component response regulator